MASSKKAIYAAIAGNFAIAVTKFIGSAISGSSAMLTEGIHSLVDTGNGGLLLLGLRRSKRPPDDTHPYGYGKVVYFYALIVAILIFGLGGGISIYEGILHTLHADASFTETSSTVLGVTLSGLMINTIVLVSAIVFEGWAFWTALKEFNSYRGDTHWWTAIKTSKDPTIFTVLFEDSAAMAGLVVALIGVHLAHAFDAPILDGIASIIIGLILCGVASLLVWESKGLLIGESADPGIERDARRLAKEHANVQHVTRAMTMQIGPETVLLTLDIDFEDDLTADEVERTIDEVEASVREAHPSVTHIFIEVESLRRRRKGAAEKGGAPKTEGEAPAPDGEAPSKEKAPSEQAPEEAEIPIPGTPTKASENE